MSNNPVSRELAAWVDPEVAYLACARDAPASFWLDRGPAAVEGRSLIGVADRFLTPLDGALDGILREHLESRGGEGSAILNGLVGWIDYESGVRALGVADVAEAWRLMRPRWVLEFDHATRRIVAHGSEHDVALLESALHSDGSDQPPESHPEPRLAGGPRSEPRWHRSALEYRAAIIECQQRIRDGDAYQLCLTNEVSVAGDFDAVETHLRLRRISPSPRAGLIRAGDTALVSSSPELFLSVTADGVAETRPIKGTRPRGATPTLDARLAEELRTSPKERAENVMIVDLMRNDLGRVCDPGSVVVPELLAVHSFAPVHQLISTVRGQLAEGRTAVDAFAVCFPAGSMTGAPKRSAVSILRGVEGRDRGAYAGAYGWFGADGSAELAMTIRAAVIDADGARVGAGGGITALSDPDDEVAEMRLKAASVLSALGVDVREGPDAVDYGTAT